MGVWVVHHEDNIPVWEDVADPFLDPMRPPVPFSAVGHVYPSPAEQRKKDREPVGDAVALGFEVDDGGLTGPDPARGSGNPCRRFRSIKATGLRVNHRRRVDGSPGMLQGMGPPESVVGGESFCGSVQAGPA